jgi:hypothetical protein
VIGDRGADDAATDDDDPGVGGQSGRDHSRSSWRASARLSSIAVVPARSDILCPAFSLLEVTG